ncbi:hypothetical protein M405DRAFT_97010 [Rhizopogon salebrosus TDB-379]|nr:hypothetical protein M405DRAFT_97010 [Rhizopogon salebrosus TDB-379]
MSTVNCNHPPVLVGGAEPAGMIAVLTLLQMAFQFASSTKISTLKSDSWVTPGFGVRDTPTSWIMLQSSWMHAF